MLYLVHSFRLDQCAQRCANLLEDKFLHAKLQNGDMIVQDAMYHKACLSNFYRKVSAKQLEGYYIDHKKKIHRIAFGEVVPFIEEAVMNATDKIPAFLLSDLIKLYN